MALLRCVPGKRMRAMDDVALAIWIGRSCEQVIDAALKCIASHIARLSVVAHPGASDLTCISVRETTILAIVGAGTNRERQVAIDLAGRPTDTAAVLANRGTPCGGVDRGVLRGVDAASDGISSGI